MPAAPLLSDEQIAERLASLPGWERRGNAIAKQLELDSFREAVEVLLTITDEADRQNHHPDVAIHWSRLTLTLWTHASGGVTERDIRLARAVDEICAR